MVSISREQLSTDSLLHGFPNSGRGWGGSEGGDRNFAGEGIFLPGVENLRRSDFDDSNLFQS